MPHANKQRLEKIGMQHSIYINTWQTLQVFSVWCSMRCTLCDYSNWVQLTFNTEDATIVPKLR